MGNYSSARDLLPDTETDSDESIEIRLLRAEAYTVSGNYYAKAIEQCEAALRSEPDLAPVHCEYRELEQQRTGQTETK